MFISGEFSLFSIWVAFPCRSAQVPPGAVVVVGRSSRSDLGSGKWTFSSRIVSSWIVAPKVLLEVLDALLHDVLGGARAGRDQDRLDPLEPLGADLGDAVDQVGVRAERIGDLGEPPAVRAVLAAQHQHQVGLRRQLADRLLAVLGGVADVVLGRIGDLRELLPRARR